MEIWMIMTIYWTDMTMNKQNFYIRLILSSPAIIISVALFWLSNQPQLPHIDFGVEWTDKMLHFIAYFCFGFSLTLAFKGNFPSWSLRKIILIVISIGLIYGISDEIHQSFVPNRTADIFDWLADATGVTVSLSLLKIINLIIKKIRKN